MDMRFNATLPEFVRRLLVKLDRQAALAKRQAALTAAIAETLKQLKSRGDFHL